MKYIATKTTTLLDALQEMYPDSSKSTLRKMLKHHRVYVDGISIIKSNHPVEIGQEVSDIPITKTTFRGVEILYEDRDIIVVNKPAKMLSTPLDERDSSHLLGILREHFRTQNIFAVHRLDKEASGVMVFARGKNAVKPLNVLFKKHDLTREYIAIVQGTVKDDKGTWESNLIELENYNVRSTYNDEEGKKAITHYSVFRRSAKFSFLKITLETGRKHQIRVHCKEAGNPIVGDKRYGDKTCDPIKRMCLHASTLEFVHPIKEKKMTFTAPIPQPFSKFGLMPKVMSR